MIRGTDGWRRARLAAGLVGYLRDPVGPEQALAAVRARLDGRAASFLHIAESSIFADPGSPHGALLRWAGWDYARLDRSVRADGLIATLSALRDDGVRTSLDEFKGRQAIRRGGLVLDTGERGFTDLAARGRGLRAATSGTSSGSSAGFAYGWSLFREEAALECLLFESHGVREAPCAFWLPALPAISGLHNLLVQLGFQRPPERWFSQIPLRRRDGAPMRYVRLAAAARGLRVPLPEPIAFTEAERVVKWMLATRDRAGAAVLKTFATSAVRVAEAASRQGLSLEGCIVFAGGEPLTERRRAFVESTGARVFARYVATETGWIAAACPRSGRPDAMHLFADRLAAIPATAGAAEPGPLLFTTISATAGTVLLNTDIGDAGRLSQRRCPCPLGRAGLDVEVSEVHGHDKLSGEGMTVSAGAARAVLDEVIAAAGGAPDSYQLREHEDATGAWRLVIVLSPDVRIDDAEVVAALLERIRSRTPEAKLATQVWRETGTIEVLRAHPTVTAGAKLKTVVRSAQ